MKRSLLIALFALLLGGMVPAAADEPTGCANPQGLDVITRQGLQSDIATPSFIVGNEYEYRSFLVDLSPVPEGYTSADALIATEMTWDVAANDYDLLMETSFGSVQTEAYQPFDPPSEFADLRAKHCEVIQIGALDWLAPVVVDSLALDFGVSSVKIVVPQP